MGGRCGGEKGEDSSQPPVRGSVFRTVGGNAGKLLHMLFYLLGRLVGFGLNGLDSVDGDQTQHILIPRLDVRGTSAVSAATAAKKRAIVATLL